MMKLCMTIALAIVLFGSMAVNAYSQGIDYKKNRLLLCYNFGSDFELYDRAILEEFLQGYPCLAKFVDIVLVPHESNQCRECREAAEELSVDCWCYSRSFRLLYDLQHAPSFHLEDADGTEILNSTRPRLSLRNLDYHKVVATGEANVTIENNNRSCLFYSVIHADCSAARDRIYGDTTLSDMPTGLYRVYCNYKIVDSFNVHGNEITEITIAVPKDEFVSTPPVEEPTERTEEPTVESSVQTAEIVAEPTVQPAVTRTKTLGKIKKTIVSEHKLGKPMFGLNGGVFLYGTDSMHEDYEVLISFGMSLRFHGVMGIEASAFLTDSMFKCDGAVAILNFCPKSLSIGETLALSIKGGVLWLKPTWTKSRTFFEKVDYVRPVAGASLFFGFAGLRRDDSFGRYGLYLDAYYSEEVEYEGPDDYLNLGGFTFGARLSIETDI